MSSSRPASRCAAAFAAGVLFLAGCRVTSTSQPAGLSEGAARHARRVATWHVHADGALRGYLQRFETVEPPLHFYFQVQNLEHQDLGLIDSQGRAWRYRPHEREAEWIATGTVGAAVAAILALDAPVELVEQPLETN